MRLFTQPPITWLYNDYLDQEAEKMLGIPREEFFSLKWVGGLIRVETDNKEEYLLDGFKNKVYKGLKGIWEIN